MARISRRVAAFLVVGGGVPALVGAGPLIAQGVAATTGAAPVVAARGALPAAPQGRGPDGGGENGGGNGRGSSSSGSSSNNNNGNGQAAGGGNGTNGNNGNAVGNPDRGNNGRGNDNGRGNYGGCAYPPGRARQVTLVGPTGVASGNTVVLSGTVTRNGCPFVGAVVGVYDSQDGAAGWRLMESMLTDDKGRYSMKVPRRQLHYYQALVAADSDDPAASSAILRLEMR